MKNSFTHLALGFFLLVGLMVSLSSCDDDEEAVKNSEKQITLFKITSLNPEVTGSINASNNTISITVPAGTSVSALVPTIEVPEKATVNPASGVAQNFSQPVTYTVTAEDGSSQAYIVTVVVTKSSEKKILTFAFSSLNPIVNGTINETEKKVSAEVPFGTGITSLIPTITTSVSASINPASGAAQNFSSPVDYTVTAEDGSTVKYTVTVTVLPAPSPVITALSKTTLLRDESFTITGSNFQSSGNKVELTPTSGSTLNLTLTAQSTTSITAKIPTNATYGEYTLSVTSNGKTTFYNSQKILIQANPNTPVITTVNKFSYTRGETMVITGQNLKKQGFASNLNFVPFPSGGTTQVRSGVANTAGTEITFTIPADFPTGNYTLSVEVDFSFSEEYGEVIQIKP